MGPELVEHLVDGLPVRMQSDTGEIELVRRDGCDGAVGGVDHDRTSAASVPATPWSGFTRWV
jgi:hypothetical protein